MAGTVTFRRDRCKGCELCTLVCPKHIIVMDESTTNRKGYHPATVRPDACARRSCPCCCPLWAMPYTPSSASAKAW